MLLLGGSRHGLGYGSTGLTLFYKQFSPRKMDGLSIVVAGKEIEKFRPRRMDLFIFMELCCFIVAHCVDGKCIAVTIY